VLVLFSFSAIRKVKEGNMFRQNNETPDFCSGCGQCCKAYPGGYAPEDLGETEEEILAAAAALLLSGHAQVDWWENGWFGQSREPYLRPTALDGKEDSTTSPTYGGRCVNLTAQGCALTFEKRPQGCRALTATAPRTCASTWDKRQACDAWEDLAEELWDLAAETQSRRAAPWKTREEGK
jgi:Fe-S-cluster containining protein